MSRLDGINLSGNNNIILAQLDFLLENFIKGDPDAFEKIYKTLYSLLYNYGCQFGIDASDVDDNIQEVFVELWNSRNHLHIKAIKPYIFSCLRNKIYKNISRNLKEKSQAERYWKETFEINHHSGFGGETHDADLEKKLAREIENLSPKQREIIFLIFYNGFSYAEVTEILGIKIKTVYNQVHNAMNSLRKSLMTTLLGILFF